MKTMIATFCFAFFISHFAFSQTIYVDISNNTGIENGTPEHPFNTINEAMDAVQDGYTVSIAPGSYPEDLIRVKKCVTVSGQGPASTIVNGTFVLSGLLETLPVVIDRLRCQNITLSDSSRLKTPVTVRESELQSFVNGISEFDSTGNLVFTNNLVNDSIFLSIVSCKGGFEFNANEAGSHLVISSTVLRDGFARITGNLVDGDLRVSTVSQKDTLYITGNTVKDSLIILSVSSYPDVIGSNNIGKGVRISAKLNLGLQFRNNQVAAGRLEATFTALDSSDISGNTFSNGGIDFTATSADIDIFGNAIQSDGTVSGIRLQTISGGHLENNTIILPYLPPSGLPFEEDTSAVCGIRVNSTSFDGMSGNAINGGTYGVHLSAVSSHAFSRNEIENCHYGLYLATVSGDVDSNRVENCNGDGMVLDFYPESDTNSIRLNHNIVRNNGGHGIWAKGNVLMGNVNEPGSGFNVIKDNAGYDLYIETPANLIDTIWAQINEWSHDTETEVAGLDIYDALDNPVKSFVVFSPILPFGMTENSVEQLNVYPNPTSGKSAVRSRQSAVRRIEVLDFVGRIVFVQDEKTGAASVEFDISHLPAGAYFCRISSADSFLVKKLVKL